MRIGIDIGSTTIKCVVLDDQGNLLYIQERTHIEVQGGAIRYTEDGQTWVRILFCHLNAG